MTQKQGGERVFVGCNSLGKGKYTTHKTAVEMVITLPRTTGDVGEMLSSTLATEKLDSRRYLPKVAETFQFLARQGILL